MCVQFSPEERMSFFAVKRAFDPKGLLNPGKAIPRSRGAPSTAACTCTWGLFAFLNSPAFKGVYVH